MRSAPLIISGAISGIAAYPAALLYAPAMLHVNMIAFVALAAAGAWLIKAEAQRNAFFFAMLAGALLLFPVTLCLAGLPISEAAAGARKNLVILDIFLHLATGVASIFLALLMGATGIGLGFLSLYCWIGKAAPGGAEQSS